MLCVGSVEWGLGNLTMVEEDCVDLAIGVTRDTVGAMLVWRNKTLDLSALPLQRRWVEVLVLKCDPARE